ncbi:MAG: peptidoglycan D,D-transpeptidase FtsI family protein [Patescibacteria group bacterium]
MIFNQEHWRLGFLFFLIFVVFGLIASRLFSIQVLKAEDYQVLAEDQYGYTYTLPAPRGKIYSQDDFPLVANKTVFLAYVEPEKVANPSQWAKKFIETLAVEDYCPIVNFSHDQETETFRLQKNCELEVVERLGFERDWVPMIRGLSREEKNKLEEYNLPGLGFEKTPERFYPESSLATQVLGFVGKNWEGDLQGYYGLEGYYNGDLSGRPGKIVEERSALGEPILIGSYKRRPPQKGRDLDLSLDRAVQFLVEEKLAQGVEYNGAKSGTVVVLHPGSGRVIAMATYPSFDPDQQRGDEKVEDMKEETVGEEAEKKEKDEDEYDQERRNLAIAATYEPGSVLKPITMAAALDTKQVTPQTTYHSRPLEIGGYTISTWNNEYYGQANMIDLLKHSDNTGAAWLALEKLGKRTLRDYFSNFGFGAETGVDLEGEEQGVVKELSELRPIDLANLSFGQGLSATPLQVASSFSAIANGGVLMRPSLVEEIHDGTKVIELDPVLERRVIAAETADLLTEMMVKVVDHVNMYSYLGKYRIAGKTGTAQIPIGGTYDPHKTNVTFVGYPAESREFVMLVKLREPSRSVYATQTAVPLWMDIAKSLVAYYGISPDR